MAGKQIRIIFCAQPGFHLPACRPSTGTLHSLGLTHTTPQQGCIPRWHRLLLQVNHQDNKQQQGSCWSCSAPDVSEAEHETVPWAPHGAQQMPHVKDDENSEQICALTSFGDITQWHNLHSHNLQIQRGKVSFQAPGTCRCPQAEISLVPILETAQTITLETNGCKACCQVWKPAQALPPEAV